MSKYQIKSNLSEKQIEADVASYFGWISKTAPFRLLDIDESITGADKKFFDSGFAFFMQFKMSKGLKPVSEVPLSTRKNRSNLEDIRDFRATRRLDDDPTLYFELRAKAKTAKDFQHNILMSYANTGISQAFYVAPLILDKNTYYTSLFNSAHRYLKHPFTNRISKIFQKDWVSYIGHIPFLKEHISIIPHEHVSTHKHYYSYSSTGGDIAWHSPEFLSEKPSRLSDTLSKNINECIEKNMLVDFRELESLFEIDEKESIYHNDRHPIERIQDKARYLYKQHGIRLTLLLANKEHVKSMKENT